MSTVILSLSNATDLAERELDSRLETILSARRIPYVSVPHLYHVAEDDRLWARLAATPQPRQVATWLHPRPAAWILARHGIPPESVRCINLRTFPSAEAAAEAICRSATPGTTPPSMVSSEPLRPRWYPVVDKSRCTDCGHCLQFCLFGVYDIAGRAVVVSRPDSCKPGCPACSRICPQGAIMFPLYERDSAIAGAPGEFVQIDDTARQMYLRRTGKPLETPSVRLQPTAAEASDLDSLVADLEAFSKGRR